MKALARYTAVAMAVAAMIMPASCNKSKKSDYDNNLKVVADSINARTPVAVDSFVTLTGVTYADKTLTFTNIMDSTVMRRLNLDSLKVATLSRLRQGLYSAPLVSNLVSAQANLKYVYIGGRDTVSIQFAHEDLKK